MRFTCSPGRFCGDDDNDNVFTNLRSALRAGTSSFMTSMMTMMTVMTIMMMTTITCLRCTLRVLHNNDDDDDDDDKDYSDDLHLLEVRSQCAS